MSARGTTVAAGLLLAGVAAIVAAAIAGSDRLWPAYYVGALYVLTLALGGLVFVAIHHVTNAAWSTAIRRIPEAMAGWLPFGAVALLVSLAGAGALFEWSHAGTAHSTPATAFREAWLQMPGFVARMVAVLALWVGFAWLLRRQSLRQDRAHGVEPTMRSRAIAAAFLVTLALSITVASVDWLMALEPHFYSTLYGWYVFAGVFASGLAAIAILVVALRARGALPHVSDEHVHALGKMVFGFSTFWAYLWYCQYMLIYYANLPEEGIYYASRLAVPGGETMFYLNLALGWGVPFIVLLGRGAKRSPRWLVVGSLSALAGHYVDIASIVLPPTAGSAVPGLVDLAVLGGFLALFAGIVDRGLRSAPMLPRFDPYLIEAAPGAVVEERGIS